MHLSTSSKAIGLAISGVSVGWLMGLSVAPTAQSVIASVLTLLVGIMGILSGVPLLNKSGQLIEKITKSNPDESQSVGNETDFFASARLGAIASIWPVAGFMAGLLLGTSLGLFTRSNKLLGPNPALQAWFWGVDRKVLMPDSVLARTITKTIEQGSEQAFLHEGSMSICYASGVVLRSSLKNLGTTAAYKMMIATASESTLITLRDEYCQKK